MTVAHPHNRAPLSNGRALTTDTHEDRDELLCREKEQSKNRVHSMSFPFYQVLENSKWPTVTKAEQSFMNREQERKKKK